MKKTDIKKALVVMGLFAMISSIGYFSVVSAADDSSAKTESVQDTTSTANTQSIVELFGSGVKSEGQPEIACRDEVLHAPLDYGLVQINDTVISVNNARSFSATDKYGTSMTIREICEILSMVPTDQIEGDELSIEDMSTFEFVHDAMRFWFDKDNIEYITIGTDDYQRGEVPLGDLLSDSLDTKSIRDSAELWFPGGISNKGFLSDGSKCTFEQLTEYASTYDMELRFTDSSEVLNTNSYRFGNVYSGVQYTVDISLEDNTVKRFARMF